jgi:hypothetical protein
MMPPPAYVAQATNVLVILWNFVRLHAGLAACAT